MTYRTRARGYIQFQMPGEKPLEFETFTCAHCNAIVRMPHPTPEKKAELAVKDVRKCFGCDSFVCPTCARVPVCKPFERWLEAVERGNRLLTV